MSLGLNVSQTGNNFNYQASTCVKDLSYNVNIHRSFKITFCEHGATPRQVQRELLVDINVAEMARAVCRHRYWEIPWARRNATFLGIKLHCHSVSSFSKCFLIPTVFPPSHIWAAFDAKSQCKQCKSGHCCPQKSVTTFFHCCALQTKNNEKKLWRFCSKENLAFSKRNRHNFFSLLTAPN